MAVDSFQASRVVSQQSVASTVCTIVLRCVLCSASVCGFLALFVWPDCMSVVVSCGDLAAEALVTGLGLVCQCAQRACRLPIVQTMRLLCIGVARHAHHAHGGVAQPWPISLKLGLSS